MQAHDLVAVLLIQVSEKCFLDRSAYPYGTRTVKQIEVFQPDEKMS